MARKTRRRVKRVRGTKRRIGVLRSRRIKRSRRYYTGGLDFGALENLKTKVGNAFQEVRGDAGNTIQKVTGEVDRLRYDLTHKIT